MYQMVVIVWDGAISQDWKLMIFLNERACLSVVCMSLLLFCLTSFPFRVFSVFHCCYCCWFFFVCVFCLCVLSSFFLSISHPVLVLTGVEMNSHKTSQVPGAPGTPTTPIVNSRLQACPSSRLGNRWWRHTPSYIIASLHIILHHSLPPHHPTS